MTNDEEMTIENEVAACLIIGNQADIETILSTVTEDDFAGYGGVLVYRVVKGMVENRVPLTRHRISYEVQKLKEDATLPVRQMAGELMTAAGLRITLAKFIDVIRSRHLRANLNEIKHAITMMPPDDACRFVGSVIDKATRPSTLDMDLMASFNPWLDEQRDRAAKIGRHERVPGVRTNLIELNQKIFAFQPGNLIVIGARPGGGKTAMACNFIKHAAAVEETGVFFASLEMNRSEIMGRIACNAANVNSQLLKHGNANEDHWDRLAMAGESMATWKKIIVNDNPYQTVDQIHSAARLHKSKNDIGIVFVDYLQLITVKETKGKNRHEVVGEISRGLKCVAKDLQIPVVALCQLKRLADGAQRRPTMNDIRESGSIEQDADVVILLYDNPGKEEVKTNDGNVRAKAESPRFEVIIEKQRDGATGIIGVEFDRELGRFSGVSDDAITYGQAIRDEDQ